MGEVSLFAGVDPRLPTPTPAQRKRLAILEAAPPLGLTRTRNGWGGVAGFISLDHALALRTAGWARSDYQGRNPRLKITRLGRQVEGSA